MEDDLSARLVGQVLCQMERAGRDLCPRRPEDRARLAEDAARMLRAYYTRSARRDAGRASKARAEGRRAGTSLEEMAERAGDAGMPCAGMYAGDT